MEIACRIEASLTLAEQCPTAAIESTLGKLGEFVGTKRYSQKAAMDDLAWAYMNPYNTGLPMAVWIGQHGYRRPPRGLRHNIRVNRRHGSIPEYIDIEEAETAEVHVETGEVTQGSLASDDLNPDYSSAKRIG